MKKILYTTLFTFCLITTMTSQVVINEIMYNPPESGQDSLEFIEFFNTGASSVDLTGWAISDAFDFTFPNMSLAAGAYTVIATDSVALMNVLGVASRQWSGSSTSNGGETITLMDASANIIDVVTYDDVDPWPTEPDGFGNSLELCNADNDNDDASNWTASANATGVMINGMEIFASPGQANNAVCNVQVDVFVTLQGISFTPADITINVGETVQWDNADGFHNVNGEQGTFPNNPEGFFSGDPTSGPWSFSYTFNTAGTYDYRCDVHFGSGMTGTVTVLGSQYPEYPIGVISSVDADGVADSIGVECQITGIVYGVNLRPGGLQMTVIDKDIADDGIGVFSFSEDWGYTVAEGDEVVIQGTISQFNGLTQINPDTVWMVSSGNALHDSEVVTDLSEDAESKLVTFENMTFVDVNGDWTGTGSGFNVDITDGVNTYTMRIDNDVDLYDMPVPTFTNFNVTGLGGQFDNSSPFLDGYQLLPRYMEDLEEIAGAELLAVDDNYTIEMNTPSTFAVLDNDNLPNGWDTVYINTQPTNGTVLVDDGDGSIDYDSNLDYCGDDSFSYIVCDNSTCDTATVSITINCPISYPQYPIGVISSVDADGVADSLGVTCEITGIVYGVNLRPGGLQMTIIDKDIADDGIGLFSFGDNWGYTVEEGDEVVIQGTISQFNGLTQISPDTVWMVSSGNTLHDSEVVTDMSEATESKLVTFENMTFVDVIGDWTGTGSGFNVDITDGVNTYTMRIDNDVDLYGMPAPTFTTFNVTGLGGQFDSSSPFLEGYQLFPRYMEDLEAVNAVVDPEIGNNVEFFPNPVADILNIKSEINIDVIQISNVLGQKVLHIVKPQNSEELNVSGLSPGIYVITFVSNDRIWSSEFVKQ